MDVRPWAILPAFYLLRHGMGTMVDGLLGQFRRRPGDWCGGQKSRPGQQVAGGQRQSHGNSMRDSGDAGAAAGCCSSSAELANSLNAIRYQLFGDCDSQL